MLGDINIDTVWPVDEMPAPGRDAYIKEMNIGLGGAVLNTAIVLDKFGQAAGMLSCLGQDVWADFVAQKLKSTNINQAYICILPECTTGQIFLVVTPDGERTMFSYRGANTHYGPQDLDEGALKNAELLHISGYSLLESTQKEATWRAVELARQFGVPVSLDSGFEPAFIDPQGLQRLITYIDICITGPNETGELFGLTDPQEAAAHLLSQGVKLAAIKLGEKGCYVANQRESCFCPAFKVDVVDTTGAGDSFSAGLLYGWGSRLEPARDGCAGQCLGRAGDHRARSWVGTAGKASSLGIPGKRIYEHRRAAACWHRGSSHGFGLA